jgi:hypothetical protein
MKRAIAIGLLTGAALLALATPAQADFGLNDFDVFFGKEGGAAATEAGSHPFAMSTSFGINFSGEGPAIQPDGEIKDAVFEQIAGLVINPTATPLCSTADFLAFGGAKCAAETRVGEVLTAVDQPDGIEEAAVFNMEPPPGSAARLAFSVLGVPVVVDGTVKDSPEYNLQGTLRNTRQVLKVLGASLTLQGVPGEVPFLTLPGSCTGPARSSYEALSWEGDLDAGFALTHDAVGNPEGFSGCEKLPFDPQMSAQPTTKAAESASGLRFELEFDQAGLLAPEGNAQSTVKEAVVALPEGVTLNPSIAEGLGVCSEADLEAETLAAAPGEGCPNASKVGTIEVATPLLEEPLPGAVYVAEPNDPDTVAPENPFDSLTAIYIVVKDPSRGVLIKLPALVEPDPTTGQLLTVVEDAPQLPFSSFSFRFREGQRAPLITPPACGTYTTEAEFVPWANPEEAAISTASFQIDAGPGGSPCPPGGVAPFAPGFQAGSLNNNAASFSPFSMRLSRSDGEQDMTKLAAVLPPGVSGKLAGLDKCPAAQIALARTKTGRAELGSPSCPSGSLIGHTLAGAGVGGALTYVSGSLYLAGPYNGAPLSVVAITPALAGPFDAGTVVVRVALRVNPISAAVEVDGAASDPIPHILQGIPLKVRELRVLTDRPSFTLNPTSCDPSQVKGAIWGSFLNVLSPIDDRPVGVQDRYQAANCARLGFKPRLAMRLKGGTDRGDHPALRAVLRPRPGDANLERAVVRLPRSAFLDQGHIRTICTRVQFAAEACPPGAIYGTVRAFTPLLSEPLQGPVYLRSSDNELPDLVLDLHGIVEIEASARIDSIRGGIRTTFAAIPDAPVSKVVFDLQGGKKGLIVNSRDLCGSPSRANVRLDGHNGARRALRPPLRAKCP